jgi:succinate dehydrogenase / fumarate reductase cytochrome b subunit
VLFSGCAREPVHTPVRQGTIALAKQLGIELWDAPARGCCGARADRQISQAALDRLLAPLAGEAMQGLSVLCLSPGCQSILAARLHAHAPGAVDDDTAPPRAKMLDWPSLLIQEEVLARLTESLTTALSPLRVALHVTCHGDHRPALLPSPEPSLSSLSPDSQAVTNPGTASDPTTRLSRLVTITGAAAQVDVSIPGTCAQTPLPLPGNSRTNTPDCLMEAIKADADLVVTPCFLCFHGLHAQQRRMSDRDPARSLPVLHLAQLLGIACGIAPVHLALDRLGAPARRVLLPFII